MSKSEISEKKSFSLDWLVQGILTKVGDLFDNLTGREWKPSSSLATSELIERLKKLLDAEVRDAGEKGRFVPHNLKLKMQWDKFSTDSEEALKKLENELLIAAIDHINDNRYQTHAPLKLQVKPDYFTEGVKLLASFDAFGEDEREVEMNVTVPQIKVGDFMPEIEEKIEEKTEPRKVVYAVEYSIGNKPKTQNLNFIEGKRLSVGRTRENALSIEDTTVSKVHAVLVLNSEGHLQVADTGSTNGTYINNRRISYGKALTVSEADRVRFGTIDVKFTKLADDAGGDAGFAEEKDKPTEVLSDSQEFMRNVDTNKIEENNFEKTEIIEK